MHLQRWPDFGPRGAFSGQAEKVKKTFNALILNEKQFVIALGT
jgi:hypothetical protein